MKKIFLVLILAGALASITKYGHAHGLSCGLYTAEKTSFYRKQCYAINTHLAR